MEVIPGIDAVPDVIGETVVTVGMFDGVHLGHRRIISIAHEKARAMGLRCVVLTFDRHPLEILKPGMHPKLLSSSAQKLRLLEELDVDMVLMAHFDEAFSKVSARSFVQDFLVGRLRAVEVVLGENFRFGRGGEGNTRSMADMGRRFGLKVNAVPLLRDDGEAISSTVIRGLVETGDIEGANRRLGWEYMIEGVVVRGDARGRELGFPTANLEVHDNRCIPANGVYSGEAHMERHAYPAVTYIGEARTFTQSVATRRRIEVHILGWEKDLYHRYLGVSFRRRLREDMTFPDARALVEQIARDVEAALE